MTQPWVIAAVLCGVALPAHALPSFSRQTGMPCVACHTTAFGPSLTPEGEAFKLLGYSLGGRGTGTPLNLLALASFTRTGSGQSGQAPAGFGDNDQVALDRVGLVYAGPVAPKVGAFAEARYDGIDHALRVGDLDLRYADSGRVGSAGYAVWGVSLNNSPTVQDLWNTAPAWSFPFAESALAPRPSALPLLEGRLARAVLGLSAYAVFDDHLYFEGGGYRSTPDGVADALNVQQRDRIDGVAPYFRVAGLAQDGRHAFRLGALGMGTHLHPGGDDSAGSDRYLDFTYDATYAYRGERRQLKVQLAFTQEAQDRNASAALGLSQNDYDWLRTYRATGILALAQAVTVTTSAFVIDGSADPTLYAPAPVTGSASGLPDSGGLIAELAYGTGGHALSSLALNYRLGLQLTHYDRFNGAHSDYDGTGRDAADNDSVYAYLWLAM